jgi:uncharacterized alpha-E superfamily protein
LDSLLARFAENSFWMARYMERAENLARILDVNETFAQNKEGVKEWLPIVQLHDDAERFFTTHEEATADLVLHFYVLDRTNSTSIAAAVQMARENARTLRHLISTETWSHLNVFHNRLQKLAPEDLALSNLSRVCAGIKEDCQLHTGIIEGTGYRNQGWYAYQIGRQIERVDQTTRLLDINYHRLLPEVDEAGSPLDASQWNALLRSVAGYHAFRRVNPRGMQPAKVAEFLLFDLAFPRSVALCIRELDALVERLAALIGRSDAPMPTETLRTLRRIGTETGIDDVLASGLHEFLDQIQRHLITLTDELSAAWFGQRY